MKQQLDFFYDEETGTGWGLNEADYFALEELKEVSIQAYDAANLAGMNCAVRINIGLYIRKVLDAAVKAAERTRALGKDAASIQLAAREAADRAALDRGDSLVEAVLTAAYKVGWETHRIMGFMRFVPVEKGSDPASTERSSVYYLARCAPDHFILPALAEHFTRRFGEKPWAVIDEKRACILIRRPGKAPSLEELSGGAGKSFQAKENDGAPGPDHDQIEDLWRLYHRSVLIENRKNLKLQRQFMPLRYRKYLAEFKTENTDG